MLDKKPCNIEMTLKDARVGQGLESQRERSLAAEVNTKVDRASNCTIEGEAALAKGTASIESASGAEEPPPHNPRGSVEPRAYDEAERKCEITPQVVLREGESMVEVPPQRERSRHAAARKPKRGGTNSPERKSSSQRWPARRRTIWRASTFINAHPWPKQIVGRPQENSHAPSRIFHSPTAPSGG